jgi:AcrR family transcriptional regulator
LLALIEQQDLNAVSIADVTRRAGVSRSTFYDHYADLHELAESACTEMFEALLAETPVFALIDGPRTGNPLVALFEHVLEHRRLYTALLGPDGSARVMGYLMRRMTITIHVNRALPDAHSRTHRDDPLEAPLDVAAPFSAGALVGVVVDWFARGVRRSPELMAAEAWPLMELVVSDWAPVRRRTDPTQHGTNPANAAWGHACGHGLNWPRRGAEAIGRSTGCCSSALPRRVPGRLRSAR